MNVLILNPERRYLNDLPAVLKRRGCTIVSASSPHEALLKLAEAEGKAPWDTFVVHQDLLQSGTSNGGVKKHRLVKELCGRFVDVPVAILSDDQLYEADDSYKALRASLRGRKGYTAYIFKHSEQDSGEVLDKCRSAILKGREEFRQAMQGILGRIALLGFDRARLWIQNLDSRYLDGFASHGKHDHEIIDERLDEKVDFYSRKAKANHEHYYCDGTEGPQSRTWLKDRKMPWLEVPLWVKRNGGEVFVGKISLDNEPSKKDLHDSEVLWPLLDKYAEMLGPIIWEARDYWMREDRARQAKELRDLDLKLVQAADVKQGMEAIAECASTLLGPDQCHIRSRRGDVLSLMAKAGTNIHTGLRPTVSIEGDKDTSVAARFASSGEWAGPRIFSREELKEMAGNLRARGLTKTATDFDRLGCCGTFGLLDSNKNLIGVLVLDSHREHYFDDERISTVKDLVARAQVLLAHSLMRKRLQSLVNALEPEVVVLDRNARVILCNQSWSKRVDALSANPDIQESTFSCVTRCDQKNTSFFEAEVYSVFGTGKLTKLVAGFDAPDRKIRQMSVLIAPFEHNDLGVIETIMVVLTDITQLVSVETLSQGAVPRADLHQTLVKPLGNIVDLFAAKRASVAECLSFGMEDAAIRIRCRVTDSGSVEEVPQQISPLANIGRLLMSLKMNGFLAVPDVDARSTLTEEMQSMLRQEGIQSLLAAPIYLSDEPWGLLAVSFGHRRNFSGHDVHLLRAAAAQLSVLIFLSQQAELRNIDREITAGIGHSENDGIDRPGGRGLLDKILGQAIRLTGCKAGHIRVIDWHRGDLEIQAAEGDPLVQKGRPVVRERIALGEPVSGQVALTGRPVVINSRRNFDLQTPYNIPADRRDVLEALQGVQSFGCFPLISGQETLGTLTLTSDTPSFFAGQRLQMLGDFIQRASLALHASRQMVRLEKMSDEPDKVLNVDSLKALWPKIPEMAVQMFLCEVASVSSYDVTTGKIRREGVCTVAGSDYTEELGETTTAADEPGCGLSRWVAKVGGVHRLEGQAALNHPHLSKAAARLHEKLPSGRFKSIILARLDMPDGKPMGVLRVINRKGRLGDLGFSEFDEALMKLLSTRLAIAIAHLQLIGRKETVIATQTHDLLRPVASILSILSAFQKGRYTFETNRLDLEVALRRARLLNARVSSMVEVAKGSIESLESKPKAFNGGELVKEAVEIFEDTFEDAGWRVTADVDSSMTVFGDREQLHRVLINLVGNSLRHGYDSNAADVSKQAKEITISLTCEHEIVRLSVADRGPGLTPEKRRRVMDGTWREGEWGEKSGSGIGLISVRMIMTAHVGKIILEDRRDGLFGLIVTAEWDQEKLKARKRVNE